MTIRSGSGVNSVALVGTIKGCTPGPVSSASTVVWHYGHSKHAGFNPQRALASTQGFTPALLTVRQLPVRTPPLSVYSITPGLNPRQRTRGYTTARLSAWRETIATMGEHGSIPNRRGKSPTRTSECSGSHLRLPNDTTIAILLLALDHPEATSQSHRTKPSASVGT